MKSRTIRTIILLLSALAVAITCVGIPARLISFLKKDKNAFSSHTYKYSSILKISGDKDFEFDIPISAPSEIEKEKLVVGLYDLDTNTDLGIAAEQSALFIKDNPTFTTLNLRDESLVFKGPKLIDSKIRYWIINPKGQSYAVEIAVSNKNSTISKLEKAPHVFKEFWNPGVNFYLEAFKASSELANLNVFSPKAAFVTSLINLPLSPINFNITEAQTKNKGLILSGKLNEDIQSKNLLLAIGYGRQKATSKKISIKKLIGDSFQVIQSYKLEIATPAATTDKLMVQSTSTSTSISSSRNSSSSQSNSSSSLTYSSSSTTISSKGTTTSTSTSTTTSTLRMTTTTSTTTSTLKTTTSTSTSTTTTTTKTTTTTSTTRTTTTTTRTTTTTSTTSHSSVSSQHSSRSSQSNSNSTNSSSSSSSSSSECSSISYSLTASGVSTCKEQEKCEAPVSVSTSNCVSLGSITATAEHINSPTVAESGPALSWQVVYNQETGKPEKLSTRLGDKDPPEDPPTPDLECGKLPGPPPQKWSQLWYGQRIQDPKSQYCHTDQDQSTFKTTVTASFTIDHGNGNTETKTVTQDFTTKVELPEESGGVVWEFYTHIDQLTTPAATECCVAIDPSTYDCGVATYVQIFGYKSQYSRKVMEEECYHEKQVKGEVSTAEGGIDVKKNCAIIKAELTRLNNLKACSPIVNGNLMAACKSAANAYKSSKNTFNSRLSDATSNAFGSRKNKTDFCYREKMAKKAVGFTIANGGFNYECAYPDCDPNQGEVHSLIDFGKLP